jgi:hypothetical protein
MEAVEFRVNGAVLEYRTVLFCKAAPDYSRYTEWRPVPFPAKVTVGHLPDDDPRLSSYDCGTPRNKK